MLNNENILKTLEKNRQKRWEKIRKKGKFKYMLISTIAFVISFGVMRVIIEAIIGDGFFNWRNSLPGFIGGCIAFIVCMNIDWHRNKKKYNK